MVYSNKHNVFTDLGVAPQPQTSGGAQKCTKCGETKTLDKFAPRTFIGAIERTRLCYECQAKRKARNELFRDENGRVRSMYHYALSCGHHVMFTIRADDEALYCYRDQDWGKVESTWRGPSDQTQPPARPVMAPGGITRRCSACQRDLPMSEYYKSTSNRYRACRTCYRAKERELYDKMPEHIRAGMLARKKERAAERRERARAKVKALGKDYRG